MNTSNKTGLSKSTLVRVARGYYYEHRQRLTPENLRAMSIDDARYYLHVGRSVATAQVPVQTTEPEPQAEPVYDTFQEEEPAYDGPYQQYDEPYQEADLVPVPVPAYDEPYAEPYADQGQYNENQYDGQYADDQYAVDQNTEAEYNEYDNFSYNLEDDATAEKPKKERNIAKVFAFVLCAVFGLSGLSAAAYAKMHGNQHELPAANVSSSLPEPTPNPGQPYGQVMSAATTTTPTPSPSTPSPTPAATPTPTPTPTPATPAAKVNPTPSPSPTPAPTPTPPAPSPPPTPTPTPAPTPTPTPTPPPPDPPVTGDPETPNP